MLQVGQEGERSHQEGLHAGQVAGLARLRWWQESGSLLSGQRRLTGRWSSQRALRIEAKRR